MWKIVLADDQKSVRQGVRDWLEDEPGFKVIGEASDGAEAVEVTSRQKPDILVTDLKMPCLDGIEVTKRVRELSPDTRVIILSMYGNKVYVDAAFKAGAWGYVLKKFSADGLTDAIRSVAGGRTYLSPSIS
jgi:DNA-binding NarL/FixJ family response regulator